MFANVSVTETTVFIEFSRWDKFLNCHKSDLVLPREQIISIDLGSDIIKSLAGMRAPGTYGFGVIAGTYRQRHGVQHFWNARKDLAEHTIRFNLLGNHYASVVVQVADPKAISENLAVSTV
jgi:hypothetical protein